MTKKELAMKVILDGASNEAAIHDAILTGEFQFYPLIELNHGVYSDIILTKFEITQDYIVDFVYLTKSSVKWQLVLCEIESPKRKLYSVKGANVAAAGGLRDGLTQIRSWKAW